jgi:glutamine cyclotransferase
MAWIRQIRFVQMAQESTRLDYLHEVELGWTAGSLSQEKLKVAQRSAELGVSGFAVTSPNPAPASDVVTDAVLYARRCAARLLNDVQDCRPEDYETESSRTNPFLQFEAVQTFRRIAYSQRLQIVLGMLGFTLYHFRLFWITAAAFLLYFVPGMAAPVCGYKVIAKFPHSTSSYTEGFFYLDGTFYEGTGLKGHSALLATEPETGKLLQRNDLPPEYFGEGIVDWGPNILEWTWQSHVGFIFDRFSMRKIGEFHYTGEGWGMTHTAKEIITSDGTATLRFRDPKTFNETHHILVKDEGKTIDQLNELEYIKGEIYANIWHSDRIAIISPENGRVIAWIDFTGLLPEDQEMNAESVLNGIAYDARKDRIFVTGKQWPVVFQIKVNPSCGLAKK